MEWYFQCLQQMEQWSGRINCSFSRNGQLSPPPIRVINSLFKPPPQKKGKYLILYSIPCSWEKSLIIKLWILSISKGALYWGRGWLGQKTYRTSFKRYFVCHFFDIFFENLCFWGLSRGRGSKTKFGNWTVYPPRSLLLLLETLKIPLDPSKSDYLDRPGAHFDIQ